MSPFLYGLLGNIAIAAIIIFIIFGIGKIGKKILGKTDKLVAFSVGLLLAIVFLGFLPELFGHSNIEESLIGILILSGILLFYVGELFLHWHHCKDLSEDGHSHHDHEHNNSSLMTAGTFLHNALHGVVLYGAFSIDTGFGIGTTLAIMTHSIPQNIANFLMNHKNPKYVYIAAGGGVFGALLVYPFQEIFSHYFFHILAVICGGLLYIAMSDMLPNFKKKGSLSGKMIYLGVMIAGICFFSFIQMLNSEHSHEDHGNNTEHHDEDEDHDEHDDEHDEDH